MTQQSLKLELTTAVFKAINQKEVISSKRVAVRINGTVQLINLTVQPIWKVIEKKGLLLVVFSDVSDYSAPKIDTTADLSSEELLVTTLEQELRSAKEHLQTTIEELQVANEELQSANEELLSANQELQSVSVIQKSLSQDYYRMAEAKGLGNGLPINHNRQLRSVKVQL